MSIVGILDDGKEVVYKIPAENREEILAAVGREDVSALKGITSFTLPSSLLLRLRERLFRRHIAVPHFPLVGGKREIRFIRAY
ncbi:hypothetical protein FA15DRAFT_358789 [Coprinopsis marcescibilis]|uniref:Uncharacterized protein n=1 Tax=Coprinopsis marcescibilis TaxID=230819 RepID=A0A5C3KBZ8_COPMA|nr:hypothetical protein FA15DRAFT_358789 [Coprinopsis marcescibilis]